MSRPQSRRSFAAALVKDEKLVKSRSARLSASRSANAAREVELYALLAAIWWRPCGEQSRYVF